MQCNQNARFQLNYAVPVCLYAHVFVSVDANFFFILSHLTQCTLDFFRCGFFDLGSFFLSPRFNASLNPGLMIVVRCHV